MFFSQDQLKNIENTEFVNLYFCPKYFFDDSFPTCALVSCIQR